MTIADHTVIRRSTTRSAKIVQALTHSYLYLGPIGLCDYGIWDLLQFQRLQ